MSCQLRPLRQSVKAARDFATSTLRSWGMASLCDDIELVVSELVTNALQYGGRWPAGGLPDTEPPERAEDGDIQLRLVLGCQQVVCVVEDASAGVPVALEVDETAESGRGLHIVESVSGGWGWAPLERGGKAVWASFACPG